MQRVHHWLLAFLGHVDATAAVTPSEKPLLQTGGLVMEVRTSGKPMLLLRNKYGPIATVSLRHVDALLAFMPEHVADLSSGVKAQKNIASITIKTDAKGFVVHQGRPADSDGNNGVMLWAADWPEVRDFLRKHSDSSMSTGIAAPSIMRASLEPLRAVFALAYRRTRNA